MKHAMFRLVPVLLIAFVFAGCTTTAKKDQGEGAAVSDQSTAEGAATMGASEGGAWTGNPLDNPDSLLYTKVIYFDFDRSDIKPEYQDIVRSHAAYLVANPTARVTLEGHADERGTREYNIGLGERRGNSVRDYMRAEGVSDAQIQTVSYGEERPVDTGNNEAAWALNRRVEMVY